MQEVTQRMPEEKPVSLLEPLLQQRWCLMDGEGGYAAGNAALLPEKLSDGLLVKATQSPVGRFVLLARLEETLLLDGRELPLSTQRYVPDVIAPRGYLGLTSFSAEPFPTWRYEGGGVVVERQIFNLHGRSCTGVAYRLLKAKGPVTLRVRPLLAFRRLDEPTFANPVAQPRPEPDRELDALRFSLYPGLPALYLSSALDWQEDACWYYGFHYPGAAPAHEREDLLCPGALQGVLEPAGPEQVLLAATEPVSHRDGLELRAEEIARRQRVVEAFPVQAEGKLDNLIRRGEEFISFRDGGAAGVLPHLPDWPHDGRAALIGLRGLALIPQRYELARRILSSIAEEYARGMIPSLHTEWEAGGDASGYDTLLWFPIAAHSYLLYTEDISFIRSRLFWTLVEIGGQIQRGLPGLRMDRVDNLLVCGEDGRPHTWMDALDEQGAPVTLRRGKPVEINALWYNACEALKEISARLGRTDLMRSYRTLSARIRESFPVIFWNPRARCLYDVVDEDHRDESIRPNQLLALSLPFRLIEGDRAEAVLKVVERELLTPCGLRTLSPRSEGYVASEVQRGEECPHLRHQGSVYPWLLGPFISAFARLHGTDLGFSQQVVSWTAPLLGGDPQALPGHLFERYDGGAPHAPRGPASSALATAELLRAFVEEVLEYPAFNIRPASE